jgi:hypothetical protein
VSITVGTDSYVTLVEADALLAHHPKREEWRCRSDFQKEVGLVEATRMMDQLRYVGRVAETDMALQALAWPRSGACDSEGRTIDSTVVPEQVKLGEAVLALHLLEAEFEADEVPRNLERVKAGNVEVEFAAHLRKQRIPDEVMEILATVLEAQNSSRLLP